MVKYFPNFTLWVQIGYICKKFCYGRRKQNSDSCEQTQATSIV